MNCCMHGFVEGVVQGVGFRQATAREADKLGLDGWVRNLGDGRVEVLFEGTDEAVQALASWLEHGPEQAKVNQLSLEVQPLQGIAGFLIRR
ncbi:acylphosphatase [Pseudomonas cuatrocienegasensis]|uniref:Acylphosphatase n=1 Tax=Pseudomonas cuatrocienegasensis TaxID=543360 RepID=A0ABY1BLX0_9PSED|nr:MULTISPECIES: acylphosphatase [Pseudomonas]OEC35213.1 acylphosphatase [Pseudomonas sp. 21C1]SER15829.1 acylphosphatase [Pseudomonas cuatrocienegasensis]